MIGKYKIITLCGSVKFKEDFLREQKRLSLDGNIVISVGMFDKGDLYGNPLTEDKILILGEMHKKKIDLADEIFVINKDKYIGASTNSEIEYAKSKGKIVKYMEN